MVSIEKCSLLQFLLAERGRSAAHLYQSRNIAEHLKTDLKPGPTISVLTLKRAFVGISDGATNCAGASGPGRNFGRSNNRSNRSRCVLRWMWLIFNRLCRTPKLAQAKLKVQAGTVPSKRGAGKEDTMKTSMLMKIVAALAICAAFPLGAIAEPAMLRERHAQPAKTKTERGVIQKVKAPRKHYFAHNWLES